GEGGELMRTSLRTSLVVLASLGLLGLAAPASADDPTIVTTKSGLKIQDLDVGKGEEARADDDGDVVEVHYTGWLTPDGVTKGKKFDSSHDHGQPFQVKLGKGRVIKGWDEGIARMKPGGKRRLIVPPDLAYGKEGQGDKIP